jgi:predicted kinase
MKTKRLIILVGPTGCGKSTYRFKYLKDIPCVSPDDFIVGRWSGSKVGLAWEYAAKVADDLFKGGVQFVMDAQFVNPATRAEWQKKAKDHGYECAAIIFDTPWKQIQENQARRGKRGLYGEIPLSVQEEKFKQFTSQMADKSILAGFDDYMIVPWEGDVITKCNKDVTT